MTLSICSWTMKLFSLLHSFFCIISWLYHMYGTLPLVMVPKMTHYLKQAHAFFIISMVTGTWCFLGRFLSLLIAGKRVILSIGKTEIPQHACRQIDKGGQKPLWHGRYSNDSYLLHVVGLYVHAILVGSNLAGSKPAPCACMILIHRFLRQHS